ncbi:hypothetical protein C8A03DRAFT_44343 [Achaetomium macrosporum]|uniref:C2H2-type domain-containing protein n=1 Tax=Achaetomium macrosporum TaxID=79813 RepID=A0AAN7C9F3_9PEZI|nr:hypothetical protein C8A03DRAFT_44343 [Achaetomium macrosporum]
MTTVPSDRRLNVPLASPLTSAAPQPPSLTSSSDPAPSSSNSTNSTTATSVHSSSVLTPSGAVSDGFPPSASHSTASQSSPGPPLYYGHMTGSWPTPGLSQPPAYAYPNPNSGAPGSGPLAQPPYARTATSYGSASSPSLPHFSGHPSSSAPNGESIPAHQSYHDQQGFPSPVAAGPGSVEVGGSLGSPVTAQSQGANQESGLTQSMLGNPTSNATRLAAPGHSTPGGMSQEGSSYRPPSTPTNYYPPSSASQQQSFPSYASPVTQPPPTAALPATASGPLPRGPASISGMAPPMQYSSGRAHHMPSMTSYASYSSVSGPVLSNMHHPGAPVAMVGSMQGLPGYSHHHGLSPHHSHHLYVHHPGGPPPQSERPFKCNECTQAFNRNHDLKRHQRIHLAIKPFGCGDCDKRFSRKDALKRHRLVKGCGGISPTDGPGGTTSANEESPNDRRTAGSGDPDGSPSQGKKEA